MPLGVAPNFERVHLVRSGLARRRELVAALTVEMLLAAVVVGVAVLGVGHGARTVRSRLLLATVCLTPPSGSTWREPGASEPPPAPIIPPAAGAHRLDWLPRRLATHFRTKRPEGSAGGAASASTLDSGTTTRRWLLQMDRLHHKRQPLRKNTRRRL